MRKILPFLFVISFILTNIGHGQVTLYSETFSGGTLDNDWYAGFRLDTIANVIEPFAYTNDPNGNGWVGKLSTDRPDSGGVAQSYSGDGTLSDFYMEANIFIPIGGMFMGAEYYGIEFRIDSSGLTTAYQLVTNFRSTSPKIRFRKRSGASPVVFKDWLAAEIPGGIPADSGWHKLGVRAVGNDFWLYYDEQELPGCPYQDTTSTGLLTEGFIGVYAFMLSFTSYQTTDLFVDNVLVNDVVNSLEDPGNVSSTYRLSQNYPNPFNPSTYISFEIPSSSVVRLDVYNALGQKIRSLINQNIPAGIHRVSWDGKDVYGNEVPAGLYFYQLNAGKFQQARKMLLVK
ncbi:MAG: T9SS type A sorting domain-containing protein [Calditrichaeota bacterium]|nr:T9SS type A sorting domain-containing protein [Calditrichota bacterium]